MRDVKKQTNNTTEPEVLAPEPSPKKIGRPFAITDAVAQEILERLGEGESLLKICRDDHMPSMTTVYRHSESHVAFREKLTRARQLQGHYLFDKMREVAEDDSGDVFYDNKTGDPHIDHARLNRHRLIVDTYKFAASKLWPRIYGDRPEPEASESQTLSISWIESDKAPIAPEPAPPKQITYQKPELPADLSERDWSVLVSLLETVKRTIPTNSDDPPELVFGIMRDALLAHYKDEPAPKKIVLRPRGKSGK
jgi:hypothetical protein